MIDQVPFIQLLADYLAGRAAEMSVKLQLGKPEAETWAKFRHASPVSGWATVEEAEATLREWFWGKKSPGAVVEREAICTYLESQGAAPLADAVRAGAQHHGKPRRISMKDSDKLFDVIAVNLCDHKVRIMATDLTAENSEAFVNIAVMRRGVEEEFFVAPPAGLYRTGDTWNGVENSSEGGAL